MGGTENTMPEQSNAALDDARKDAGLTQAELWLRYFGLGGMSMPLELEAYLFGLVVPSTHDRDVLVHAFNDRFTELGRNHPVPYAGDPTDEGPDHDPPETSPRVRGASEPLNGAEPPRQTVSANRLPKSQRDALAIGQGSKNEGD